MSRARLAVVLAVGVLILAGVSILGVGSGSTSLPPGRVVRALFNADVSDRDRVIVWHVRLPRVLTGAIVGGALALSGALLQGLFRNPMASPGIIGVSTGGALGATAALGLGFGAVSLWAVPLAAFAGALGSTFLVYALATRRGRTPLATLILCGMAVSSITGALTSLVLSLSLREWEVGRQVLFWLMGGLTDRTWQHVAMAAPFLGVAVLGALFFPRELNVMASGEEAALALGVDTTSAKRWILVLSACAAGAAVAVAGAIGFVGLLVPHAVRLLVGPDHRRLLPACLVLGAAFLVGMDLISRVLLGSEEVRLGILTAGLGGPFFLGLVLKHRARVEALG